MFVFRYEKKILKKYFEKFPEVTFISLLILNILTVSIVLIIMFSWSILVKYIPRELSLLYLFTMIFFVRVPFYMMISLSASYIQNLFGIREIFGLNRDAHLEQWKNIAES